MQVKSIDDLKNRNSLFKIVVPVQYKESFKFKLTDYDNTLKSIYMNSQNIVLVLMTFLHINKQV